MFKINKQWSTSNVFVSCQLFSLLTIMSYFATGKLSWDNKFYFWARFWFSGWYTLVWQFRSNPFLLTFLETRIALVAILILWFNICHSLPYSERKNIWKYLGQLIKSFVRYFAMVPIIIFRKWTTCVGSWY